MPPLEKPFHWLAQAARYRAFWLGLPLLLYVWTITGPFVADDLHLVLKAESYLRGESPAPGLFRFARTPEEWRLLRDRGDVPWWTPPVQRVDLFRPLAEWSFCLDMLLFGRNPTGHRLVSLAWFAIALICTRRLFLTACSDSARAGVATFLYGISQTLTQPATFICNRSDLMAIAGTTLAAGAYCHSIRRAEGRPSTAPRDSPPGETEARSGLGLLLLAGIAYAFGLLSKEMAVGLGVVVVAHEAVRHFRRRTSPDLPRPARHVPGMITLTLGAMAAAYVIFYAVTRPWHLGLADDAGRNNISALAAAPRALPLYIAVWTTGFPISALIQAGAVPVFTVGAAGLLVLALGARHLRRLLRSDPAGGFFLLWAAVFLGIALLTIPETRVLSLATVGWAYFLSGLLSSRVEQPPLVPLWLRHWLFAVNGAVSICCAIAFARLQTTWEQQSRQALAGYLAASKTPLRDGDTLIVAQPQSEMELLFAGDRLEFVSGRRDCALVFLTLPSGGANLRWINDRSLKATSVQGDLLGSPTQRFLLGPGWKPVPGYKFHHRDFEAEVAAVSGDGRVQELDFRFKEPITSPRLRFIAPRSNTPPHLDNR